jgi:signal transduction histidine kinase
VTGYGAVVSRHLPDRTELALAAAAMVFTCVGVWIEVHYATRPVPSGIWAYLLTLAACCLMPLRRRQPHLVALACLLALLAYHLIGYQGLAPGMLMFVGCYALGAYAPRGGLVLGLLAAGLAWAVAPLPPYSLPWAELDVSMPSIVFGAAAVVGRSARGRRLEQEARIRQSEAVGAEHAARRLAEERLRIARELHDVLAHTISVVAVQSAVALDAIEDDPDQAKAALTRVRAAARQAMPELRAALDLLRGGSGESGGAGASTADLRPQPGLDSLAELADRIRASGLPVELVLDPAGLAEAADTPDGVPPLVQLTAYRIVQESLTNALRHSGATRVSVAVRRREHTLEVDVMDDGPGPGGSPGLASGVDPHSIGADTDSAADGARVIRSSGFGLQGMRERAEALGGTLAAGFRLEGGFAVHALLPFVRVGIEDSAANVNDADAVDAPAAAAQEGRGNR